MGRARTTAGLTLELHGGGDPALVLAQHERRGKGIGSKLLTRIQGDQPIIEYRWRREALMAMARQGGAQA